MPQSPPPSSPPLPGEEDIINQMQGMQVMTPGGPMQQQMQQQGQPQNQSNMQMQQGQQQQMVDQNGNVVQMVDQNGNPVYMSNPMMQQGQMMQDQNGNMVEKKLTKPPKSHRIPRFLSKFHSNFIFSSTENLFVLGHHAAAARNATDGDAGSKRKPGHRHG